MTPEEITDLVNAIIDERIKELNRVPQKATKDECIQYAKDIGMFESFGEFFFDKMIERGWKGGKNKPVKDWKATMRNWSRAEWNKKYKRQATF